MQAPAPGVRGAHTECGWPGRFGPKAPDWQPPASQVRQDRGCWSFARCHPPVDVDRQEVLEDGELHDREKSCQDGEELGDFASPSSSITPEPEMINYWKSSIPAFSFSSSFHPLLSALGRTKKWSNAAAPDFAPPKQEPFASSLFNAFKESSKSAYDNAIHLSSSGAAGHAIAYAAARVGVMQDFLANLDATPEEREEAAPWVRCCSDVAMALQDASCILGANYAHGLLEVRKGAMKSASHHLMPILRDSPPSGGYYFGIPKEKVLSSAQFLSVEASLAPASRPSAPRPPRRFFQRPPAPRGSAAPRSQRPLRMQLLPPLLRRLLPP